MLDSVNSIMLLIPVLDIRQMVYASADDMVDSWIYPDAVNMKVPVAPANLRSKKAAGIHMVARKRTIDSKHVVPHPSSYVRYRESLPMLQIPYFKTT